MRAGIIKISPQYLKDGIGFPKSWDLISLKKDWQDFDITALIEGPDFPEVEEGKSPKLCEVIIRTDYIEYAKIEERPDHKREYRFEVKEVGP